MKWLIGLKLLSLLGKKRWLSTNQGESELWQKTNLNFKTYLWDLEQTFAPFPAKDPPLSFTYPRRIKLAVQATHNKETLIFSCEMLPFVFELNQARLLNSWKLVVSIFNTTNYDLNMGLYVTAWLHVFPGPSPPFQFTFHVFSVR